MMQQNGIWELDIVPPLEPVRIVLDLTPPELELAVATSGTSLCAAMMKAIVAAMVVDTAWQDAQA
jgi:hypothetical protein